MTFINITGKAILKISEMNQNKDVSKTFRVVLLC
jgi:hypothetical protein